VVPEEDPEALKTAIARLLDDREFHAQCKANLAAARPSLQWDVTLKPLIEFCRDERPPVAPKWERLPGLAQRVAVYAGRRAIFQLHDKRDERRRDGEKAAAARREARATRRPA
jgi:hypothetical protein